MHDGRLAIGGCDVLELAREYGTPAYVVAEDDLRSRAREFVRAMGAHHGGTARVLFAAKAFPCTAVLRIFAEEGLGVDVASAGELFMALRAGFDPSGSSCTATRSRYAELRDGRRARLVVAIDNLDEIDRLERLAGAGPQPVLLRVVPEVHTDTHDAVATGPRGPEVRAHAGRGRRGGRPPQRRRLGRRARHPRPHRLAAVRPRPLPRGGGGDRRARPVPGLRPRRRPRGRLHARAPAAVGRRVGGGCHRCGARAAGCARGGAVDRARARARRQRGRDALHRRVGQAPRLDVGGGRRRHERQPAPDALRRALHGRRRRPARARRPSPASAATWPASTASRAT